jgi:hypothetical protein
MQLSRYTPLAPDSGDTPPQLVIYINLSSFVDGDACVGEPEVVGIGTTSHRDQEMRPAYRAIADVDEYPIVREPLRSNAYLCPRLKASVPLLHGLFDNAAVRLSGRGRRHVSGMRLRSPMFIESGQRTIGESTGQRPPLPRRRRNSSLRPAKTSLGPYSIRGRPTSGPRSKLRGVQEYSDPSRAGSRWSQSADRARGR